MRAHPAQLVRIRANTELAYEQKDLPCVKINESLPSGNRHEFILPAIRRASWDGRSQTREEVYFNKGRIIVGGKLATRGQAKRPTMSFTSSPTSARVRISSRT